MKTRQPNLLLHPVFLVNLIILLLNDFYLKQQYSNWITGKLSDFSGLFVFAIFFISIFPLKRKLILILTALFFIWWKSPLSEFIIRFLQVICEVPINRVIDYSDLLALIVLPFAYYLQPRNILSTYFKQFAIYAVGITCIFSFCATSVARQIIYYPTKPNEILFKETFTSTFSEKEILIKLDPLHLGYSKDSVRYYKVIESEDLYFRVRPGGDSSYSWVPVPYNADSVLFVKRVEPGFYTIPRYVLNKDTLLNLEITIYPTGLKKGMAVRIESFQTTNGPNPTELTESKKLRRIYKRHFTRLLR